MSRPLKILLPDEMADAVRERVASGQYVDESDVVRDGLRALAERERAVEAWLAGPVMREYAAWEAGTLETIDLADIREEIERERASGH